MQFGARKFGLVISSYKRPKNFEN